VWQLQSYRASRCQFIRDHSDDPTLRRNRLLESREIAGMKD